jgi:hypothetical protein
MNRLTDHDCRCYDDDCLNRHGCLRWLENGGLWANWRFFMSSLRQPGADSCLYQIRPEETDEEVTEHA